MSRTDEKQKAKLQSLLHGMTAEPETARQTKRAPVEKKAAAADAGELIQISAHIPKTLHRRVKVALAGQDDRATLTDLLIKLLSEWADKNG